MIPDMETADAVICPEEFNCRRPLDALIKFSPIEKPPMIPEPVATMSDAKSLPLNNAFDAVICPLAPLRFN